MVKQAKINVISLIMLAGMFFAICYHFILWGSVFKKGYPDNTFLFRPEDRFGDWIHPYSALINFTVDPHTTVTPVPGELPYYIESLTGMPPEVILFIYLASFTALFFCLNFYYLQSKLESRPKAIGHAVIWTFGYPFLVAVDRANMDIWLVLVFAAGVILYDKAKPVISPILFGVLTGMKPPLGILSLMYVLDRKWLSFLTSIATTILLSLGCYFYFSALFNGRGLTVMGTGQYYTRTYEIGPEGLFFGHSLFGMFRLMGYLVFSHYHLSRSVVEQIFAFCLPYYLVFSLVSIVSAVAILYIKKLALWENVTCLCCLLCLMPFVSSDYRLLYFSIPMLLFVNAKESKPTDGCVAVLFALLVIPKAYIRFNAPGLFDHPEATSSIFLNPIVLTLLLCVCLFGLRKRECPSPLPIKN